MNIEHSVDVEQLIQRIADLEATVEQLKDEEIKHNWYCGCGHWNGANLSICSVCRRKPNGEMP